MQWMVCTSIIFFCRIVSVLCTKYLSLENICDVIGIFVSAFSAGATVYLGIIANAQNKRLIELEKNSTDIERSSCVILERCDETDAIILSNESKTYDEDSKFLYLQVCNCGEAALKKIEMNFEQEKFCSHLCLAKERTKNIQIAIPDSFNINARIEVKYTSCYGVESHATFRLHQTNEFFIGKYYHYKGLVNKR